MLFHVTANSDWSNLPISGLFVEMLRRISTLGGSARRAAAGGETTRRDDDEAERPTPDVLPPCRRSTASAP